MTAASIGFSHNTLNPCLQTGRAGGSASFELLEFASSLFQVADFEQTISAATQHPLLINKTCVLD